MFALPGILGLIFIVYIRPQEILTDLQSVPLLYLFFALAVFGFAVDLRLRINKASAVPQLRWAILLLVWGTGTVVMKAPENQMVPEVLELTISVTLFFLIAHSVHTFRAFQMVTGLVLALVVTLAILGIHQRASDWGCMMLDLEARGADLTGTPDGRSCQPLFDPDCYQGDPEPGREYICERIGLFGTSSVEGRVRYRGKLQDPNELALALAAGMAFAFAFADRRRGPGRALVVAIPIALVAVCVYFTQSRGGQLVFLTVLGVYAVWRWRWKAVAAGFMMAPAALFLLMGTSERANAADSSYQRMEAWATGVDLFRQSPLFGVGKGQFVEHHWLTAHNSYVLALAETGIVGFFLWGAVLYLSVKIVVVALRRYHGVEEARVAQAWGLALLASLAGLGVGIFFLSFAWHDLFWIYMGLVGAYYSAIRTHDPDFRVRLTWIDSIGIVAVGFGIAACLFVYLRLRGY